MDEPKVLTFSEASKIDIMEDETERKRLLREARLLKEAFPDNYMNMVGYERCQSMIERLTRNIDLTMQHASHFARLDEVLEKLLQRVQLKPLDYGYWLMRQSKAYERPCMQKIAAWDCKNLAIDLDNHKHTSELSVFKPAALYFEFPGYSGTILYMRAFAEGKPGSIILEVGIQVVDNLEAYGVYHEDRKEYATIETCNFQPYYKNKCFSFAFEDINERDELTCLNIGYVEGVWQILTGIIKDGYMDLFGFEEGENK